MSTDNRDIVRLSAHPNNYEWGKLGNESLAARLAPLAEGSKFELKESKPYAELWMGTHPNNPSNLFDKEILLSDYLKAHPTLLGDAARFPARYPGIKGATNDAGGHVPFLFKILTCKQALPLQIHPDVELAKKLHQQDPHNYPDTNHKPEIAVCLGDEFYGFAQFRPLAEIKALLSSTTELQHLSMSVKQALDNIIKVDEKEEAVNDTVKNAWGTLLSAMKDKESSQAVEAFTARVESSGVEAFSSLGELFSEDQRRDLAKACKILEAYNPGDVSIFATLLFMNLIKLKKGEGIYVGADGPHAWLQGEIVELMAASDNVLNVGFTPEQDPLQTVIPAISGKSVPADMLRLSTNRYSKSSTGNTTVYSVPFEEFSIMKISGADELQPLSGPGIAIVLESQGTKLQEREVDTGSVWFVPAGTGLIVEGEGELWMAFHDKDS